ncbi:MAG TPA: pyridoxal phosphate-dependent aminotransferase [Clostridia bacterium]|nr:pyridoxal phosphate-dependent aminotransferase [Clostridia bacterium]
MKLSKRLNSMQESPIRKLVPIAEEAKLQGKKVYHLNIGQPDIMTPEVFLKAIRDFDEEVIKYSFSQGEPKLIESIIDYYKTYDMSFEKDEILITNGGSEALLFALIATCDAGDEVLVPEPFYTNYNGFSLPVGVKVSPITTHAENGFALPSKDEIQDLITDKTKAIMLSNPGNPTGVIYTDEEVNRIADLAIENDLYIIADEVYREFVYDDFDYTSFGNIDRVKDRVIIIDSISKRYSACGARIGSFASKNKDLVKGVLKLCQSRLCVPTLEQIGATELYKVDQSYFEDVNTEYKKRRDIVFDALNSMNGVICKKPHGAFYIIAKLPVEDAEDFVIWMLKEFSDNSETVMFAPAEGFYATEGLGKDEIRIAYILNEKDLKRSMELLEMGLKEYKNK